MELLSIEGNRQKLDAGSLFGNAPKAMWSRWVEVDEQSRMELACRALLARDLNGKTVLFEAGIGDFFEPKLKQRFGVYQSGHILLQSLGERGIMPEDIDLVVLSHLHFDHSGGLLTGWREDRDLELVFPNADYLVGEQHWQRAENPHLRDRASFIPKLQQLLKQSGRLHLLETGTTRHQLLGDEVYFEVSHGHTPGLIHAVFDDLVFTADLIPGRAWTHVPLSMGYDRFPELLIDEKKAFLERHLEAERRLFFTHDPDCCVASISFENGKYQTTNAQQKLHEKS